MELVTRVIGPLQTNVHLVADPRTREAIAIDAAIPGLPWITGELAARGWRLALIVSTHGHWDHAGENAALQAWSRERAAAAPEAPGPGPGEMALAAHAADHGLTIEAPDGRLRRPDPSGGAEIAAHPADWYRLVDPQPLFAPFPIPPCIPAAELAEGAVIRFGDVRLDVLHTPGHTEGSVCLVDREIRDPLLGRHPLHGRVGEGGPAGRRPRRDGGVPRPAGDPPRWAPGPARTRERDDDRPGAPLAGDGRAGATPPALSRLTGDGGRRLLPLSGRTRRASPSTARRRPCR